jgi:hypothetical protein
MDKRIGRTISKGQGDIELLGALAGNDSSRFSRVIARLEGEARQIANELLDGENIEEAVSKARDKVIDWMRSDAAFRVNHPMAYARKLVHNAVIDYARTNKERAIPEDQIKEDLAWIDEGMGYFGGDEEANEPTMKGGWHGVEVSQDHVGRDILKLPTIHYPEHRWLRALQSSNLARCADWFFVGRRRNDINKRWAQYKLIMALIENIPGLREQHIMKHFLWGYRATDIAREYEVNKAYVSKVVNKWLRSWGWDKVQVERNRIVLLTHYLATLLTGYYKTKAKTYRKLNRELNDRMEALVRRKWDTGRLTKEEDQEIDRLLEECHTKARLEHIEEERTLCDELYHKVTKATETKACFSDLQESDSLGLLEICSTCYQYWYG